MHSQIFSQLQNTIVLTSHDDVMSFRKESRTQVTSKAQVVLLPDSTKAVSDIVRLCSKHNIPMVAQGGNTGRVLGSNSCDAKAVIISTNRLNKVRELDVVNRSITVEAGVILEDIQKMAEKNGLFFPLSIGAQGSCQIGGNLATNCGGMNTLRYGNTRDLVLGIEAVMANGEVVNVLHKLRKHNAGYDLRNLLIGSEGTLGIITACSLKLYPPETVDSQAFVGLNDIDAAVSLLNRLQLAFPNQVSTFELIGRRPMSYVERYGEISLPIEDEYEWYVWYRLAGTNNKLEELHLNFLAESDLMAQHPIVFAQNVRQKKLFRDIRETVVKVQSHSKSNVKFDVSVPIVKISELITLGNQVADIYGFKAYPFGHVGDGNIHYNFTAPDGICDNDLKCFTFQIYDIVASLGGSYAAEHGVGKRKIEIMKKYADPVALSVMKSIKHSLDPKGLLNPDTLF